MLGYSTYSGCVGPIYHRMLMNALLFLYENNQIDSDIVVLHKSIYHHSALSTFLPDIASCFQLMGIVYSAMIFTKNAHRRICGSYQILLHMQSESLSTMTQYHLPWLGSG